MSHYRRADNTQPGARAPQGYRYSSSEHAQSGAGYRNRVGQAHPQPRADTTYHQQQYGGSRGPQYPYYESNFGASSYMQNAAGSSGAYPVQTATDGYGVAYQSNPYAGSMLAYDQQSPPWTQTPVISEGQSVMQQQSIASPVECEIPPGPSFAPRAIPRTDTSYWPESYPGSSIAHPIPATRPTDSGADYVVPCPYNCGTVLTGVHAVGNMTRHLKSQNCIGSGKEKPKYVCSVEGCEKRYIRSDGLKVHLRKRHNISQPSERDDGSEYAGGGYGYS